MTSISFNLASFPEELLERILALCVIAPLSPPARPSWHLSSPTSSSSAAPSSPHQRSNSPRGRLAPLLVCKSFLRIATPLFYNTVHISSRTQLRCLLKHSLRPNPMLATYIRRVVLTGVWAEAGELLRMCRRSLRMLDLTLDTEPVLMQPGEEDNDAKVFCASLKHIRPTQLALRKPANVYLTQAKPKYVIWELSSAMRGWYELESADIAFRLSDDNSVPSLSSSPPSLSPVSRSSPAKQTHPGPITFLTHTLSTLPYLRTFITILPSVWNETILRVSENPSLERIVLGEGNSYSSSNASANQGILGTGLFLSQARKHSRLVELIRAGTPIIRSRAHTMGTVGMPPVSKYSSMPSSYPQGTSSSSAHLSSAGKYPPSSSAGKYPPPSASSGHRFPTNASSSSPSASRTKPRASTGTGGRGRLLSTPSQ
ncbi:hypothetical protein BDQ12DRAFT_256591 [Crucibulum laeve]|uniref:Uncharacterized protein n=1 Tax=Crucibulum laeve TaxID=68775 RepID=A0A5C3LV77_9AGAR|nr:hypothetical protein BDQ12DRAFT_256591 [Crucibulum laeve]